jgi:hypothetical protein
MCDERIRCLNCETSFRNEGYLFAAAEWLRIRDPFLASSVAVGMHCELSARKWRLLVCAIGRSAFDWCHNPWFRDALQIAERWADDGTAPRGVKTCRVQLGRVEPPSFLREFRECGRPEDWFGSREAFDFQLQQEREQFAWLPLARRCVSDDARLQSEDITEGTRPLAADLLREFVPNPFAARVWNPDWFTSTVCDLAAHIYATREFGTMPILADALQDAGCDDEQILNHCRAEKSHARGCWVLDAILVKT